MNEYAAPSKWKELLNISVWVVLGGLLVWGYQAATAKSDDRTSTVAKPSKRKQVVQEIVNTGPQTKAWETPQGTIIEVSIPKATIGGHFVEVRNCIVWRDTVTKTSSMFCDPEQIDPTAYPSDPPEYTQ